MVTIRGGDKLERKLADLRKKLGVRGTLRVGFLPDSTYPDGTSVALVGVVQNFGSPSHGIPPRPFFSNMVRDKSPDWGKSLGRILKGNGFDAEKGLDEMGHEIEGQLRQSIKDTNSPPLKPATIKRKGFAKPLIGKTGTLYNSVDHEVKT